MHKVISLTKNKVCLVDEEDYEYLNQFKWYCVQGRYAVRDGWDKVTKGRVHIRMHRLIMNCPADLEVDHLNGDTLDNRKDNLRVVTHKINGKNTHGYKKAGKTSRFRGVCSARGFWLAQLCVDGASLQFGHYDTEVEAALAYNKAVDLYCDFLNKNIITEEDINSIPYTTRKVDKRGKVLFLYA